MLGQLTGQEEAHRGLHLPRGDGGPLVVVGQAGSLGRDALKDVVHERVHDAHGLGGDAGVGVHLLQDLRGDGKTRSIGFERKVRVTYVHVVDVDGVGLLPPLDLAPSGLGATGLLQGLASLAGWLLGAGSGGLVGLVALGAHLLGDLDG